jgi:hypothetical protein
LKKDLKEFTTKKTAKKKEGENGNKTVTASLRDK